MMSLQKESGTVKLHLDLSPSCQVKTIDGKPLDFIPEVKIPSLQKESEWKEQRKRLRMALYVSVLEDVAEDACKRIDTIIECAVSQREKEIAEEVESYFDNIISAETEHRFNADSIKRRKEEVLKLLKH